MALIGGSILKFVVVVEGYGGGGGLRRWWGFGGDGVSAMEGFRWGGSCSGGVRLN